MAEEKSVFVALEDLRIGMFIHLDLGWMSHPFPSSSFKIANTKQLETIRSLGLSRVRYSPSKSDAEEVASDAPEPDQRPVATTVDAASANLAAANAERHRQLLQAQRSSFALCEEKFNQATVACSQILAHVGTRPEAAKEQGQALVNGIVDELMAQGESMIHLLSDGSGERAALHPVNVTILSLLLGKSLEFDAAQLRDLGLAALLHDIGKEQLPQRVRWHDASLLPAEEKVYRSHVALGVATGRRMGLSTSVLLGISQHHEMVDGSGYPVGVKGDSMSAVSRVLALVNRYDNLCNPFHANQALTPHEALALTFAQAKTRFDALTLNAFVRLMGVYPPGSVVQMLDDRYGLVMTVNSARPLRPQVVLYDPEVPKDQALIVDLEQFPDLGIKRSLKPLHLPQAALSYLSPRKRISYFFDQRPAPLADESPP